MRPESETLSDRDNDLTDDLRIMLSVDDSWLEKVTGDEYERLAAADYIMRGSLQLAASRLLRQKTQVASGESQLYEDVSRIERLRAELRARRLEEERATRKRRATKKPAKKSPKPKVIEL